VTAALAAVFLGAVPKPAPLIVYSAPAAERPAGADAIHPTDAVLPNGRLAAPAGLSTFVGTNPLGFALTPDGRFAIVSNDDQRTGGLSVPNSEPPLAIGYSLSVVDTKTMGVVSVFHDPSATFFVGVGAVRDPANPTGALVFASDGTGGVVRVYSLDDNGQLAPRQTIALPSGPGGHAFPAGITVAPNGAAIFVADNLNDTVSAIDVASMAVVRTMPVGFFPITPVAGGTHLLVSGGGLSSYAPLDHAARVPQFAAPPFDPLRSSSLAVFGLAGNGFAADPSSVLMDPQPDGVRDIGGADPGAIAISPDGQLAYVALSNVDRVAVVSLDGSPRVIRGLDLRLFPDAPYGAQPSAEVLSHDGKRLYVALAGLNAVAILDARAETRYRYGLFPTAWYPTALAISPNGRFLYVLNTKGVDGWGILQRIDMKHTSLVKATLDSLRYNRTPAAAKPNLVIPPLRSAKRSDAIDHVVYIAIGSAGFDAMLGDLRDPGGAQHGNGDPGLSVYPETVTPNIHSLANSYALADNYYASDANLDLARQFALASDVPMNAVMTANVTAGRAALGGHAEDPEDYPRAGYLFNAMARAGLSYRDYGGLLRLAGEDAGAYDLNVPALAALSGNVDLDYPGYDPNNAKITDAKRAQEFQTDMQRYVTADQVPSFTYIWLPMPSRQGGAADADRALGAIIEYLSHTPHWSSTAVFIAPEGVSGSSDHVNALRGYALLVSPLARRGYIGHVHLSEASVVKTEEEILGLDPLSLSDLLATDMADFFVDAPAPEPYQAIH
jgi:YVTN family beta-propeller protein